MALPPFHEDLGPDGHLYALAVVAGRYLHRTSGGSEPAHFVLRWSPSPDLSPFSLGSVAADGRYLSYHRLMVGLDTPEFAVLRAAGGEGVPAHCWRLYPRSRPSRGRVRGRRPPRRLLRRPTPTRRGAVPEPRVGGVRGRIGGPGVVPAGRSDRGRETVGDCSG